MLTDLPKKEAETLLEQCNGELKTAVMSNVRDVSPDKARDILNDVDGRLRAPLKKA